jgi:hypothetical protein
MDDHIVKLDRQRQLVVDRTLDIISHANSGAGDTTGSATNRRMSLLTIAPLRANRIRKRLGDDMFTVFDSLYLRWMSSSPSYPACAGEPTASSSSSMPLYNVDGRPRAAARFGLGIEEPLPPRPESGNRMRELIPDGVHLIAVSV